MLDAYIIDQIKREEEEKRRKWEEGRRIWQEIPLPEYWPEPKSDQKPEEEPEYSITISMVKSYQ